MDVAVDSDDPGKSPASRPGFSLSMRIYARRDNARTKTQFLDLSMFFTACQAQFRLSTNGGPIDSLYHSDNLNIFRDEFSQFWLRNGLTYVWQFVDLKGNAFLAEGGCAKIN
jgi:hypothetical protein